VVASPTSTKAAGEEADPRWPALPGEQARGEGATYALLLLVLIDPFIALLFAVGGWQYRLLTVPILALLAPTLVCLGTRGYR
jgi:hypothetical protein